MSDFFDRSGPPASDWAFKTDRAALTLEQRARVRQEILAFLAEVHTHEAELVQRIADRVGRLPSGR